MEKFVMLSILFVNIGVPARAATKEDGRAALVKAIKTCIAFDIAYVFLIVFVVPRLF
jgi:hypothetical protein